MRELKEFLATVSRFEILRNVSYFPPRDEEGKNMRRVKRTLFLNTPDFFCNTP